MSLFERFVKRPTSQESFICESDYYCCVVCFLSCSSAVLQMLFQIQTGSCLGFLLRAFGLRVQSALSRGCAVSALWWLPFTATRTTSCCSTCATRTRRRMFTFTSPYRKRATPFPALPLMDWSGHKSSFSPNNRKNLMKI